MALPRSVLPGIPRGLRRQPRRAVHEGRHPEALPRLLRRHRPADRSRDRQERSLREEGEEPARLLHGHRPRGRRPRPRQHRPERILDGHDAPRTGPLGLFQPRTSRRRCRTCSARSRTSSPPRASRCSSSGSRKSRAWLEKMGVKVENGEGVRDRRREGAAEPAAHLQPLVPGHAPLREGDVREPGAGPQQAVVGPGREVPAGEAARRIATPRTTPARSTSAAPRSTTTTT